MVAATTLWLRQKMANKGSLCLQNASSEDSGDHDSLAQWNLNVGDDD